MDGRRNSASYSRQPAQPMPQNFNQHSASSSYRRYPKQPEPPYVAANDDLQAQQDYDGDPTWRPAAPNGTSRSNSHRRRCSLPKPNHVNAPSRDDYKATPEAPRGPSVSYKEPYMGSFAAPARSRSQKRYPQILSQQQPQFLPQPQPPTDQTPSSRRDHTAAMLASPMSPMSSTSPNAQHDSTRRSSADTSGAPRRKNSVSNRSPLQRLEGALDDISKEEKRARVQEAEAIAEEKAAAARAARNGNYGTPGGANQTRRVSGPEMNPAPVRASSNRRNVTMPAAGLVDSRRPETYQPEYQQQFGSVASRSGSQRRSHPHQHDGPEDPRRNSYRERYGPAQPRTEPAHSGHNAGLAFGAASAAIADRHEDDRAQPNVGQSNSRKLQKRMDPNAHAPTGNRDPATMPAAHNQMEADRMGTSQGRKAAAKYQDPDPFPKEAVRNRHGAEPKYEVPPQTAGGQRARERVGFGTQDPVQMGSPPQGTHHRHLPHMFHQSHHEDRRYKTSGAPMDEWKTADAAALTADDLDLDDVPGNADPKAAWWENGASPNRHSGRHQGSSTYDGAQDGPQPQTSFQPRLYLKCGPLLRYTGLRRESRMGRSDREIWRGSIMIVTIDAYSSYEKVPVLRLFVQPKDLLPPPPAQLDDRNGQQLAPEYVDPLAGEVKSSRTGKTLYVRPVEDLEEEVDLSRREDDTGLFEESRSALVVDLEGRKHVKSGQKRSRIRQKDGEKAGKYREVKGARLYAERGVTFWRFNLEVELGKHQARLAYRINKGPAIGFWVPAKGETMNIMFHSCNGFSLSVDSNSFSGPDPLWRDVLNNHQTRPFHVMIGGGDQIYNDAATKQTTHFQEWLAMKNAAHKHSAEFTAEMQDELEDFYLNRYAMWFSQGFFGMANSQIPMVNIWDDHDIIDGYGSYPHHFMKNAVFTGLGAVAFKYYMLFQHQSVPDESEVHEPSWILGAAPGPYISQLSRNLFMFLGKNVAFVGLDCRTERMRDSILSEDTYYNIFNRCRKEIVKGETKHLIVLLGVPIAYPRLNFLENVLTSRVMDPIKALGRTGMLGGFVNKFDGGVEILDDLDDHWTAKHHKQERNWFIQELQEIAAEKSVRITILGGDVHLAAVGQFYSNKKLGIPKDRDHRYMPNVISSAIVNTPPPELMGDILNKRNKVHHLDADTDEDMIPMFSHDVDGKPRNNNHLLPRRNWCSLREYNPGHTPPATPPRSRSPSPSRRPGGLTRTFSLSRKDFSPGGLVRRFSNRGAGPPPAYYNNATSTPHQLARANSLDARPSRPGDNSSSYFPSSHADANTTAPVADPPRPNPFHRRPTGLSMKAAKKGGAQPEEGEDEEDPLAGTINLKQGLDIVLNLEVSQKDPAGITTPYRLLVPALWYEGPPDRNTVRRKSKMGGWFGGVMGKRRGRKGDGEDEEDEEDEYYEAEEREDGGSESDADEGQRRRRSIGGGAGYGGDGQGGVSYGSRAVRKLGVRFDEPEHEQQGGRYADEKYGDEYGEEYGEEGSMGSYEEERQKRKPAWKIRK